MQRLTGDHPAAAASLTRALQLFRDLGDRRGQAEASVNLGELLLLSSAHREARGYFAQALSIARDIKAPVLEALALEGIGRSHIREGDPGQGAAHLRQALAIYRRIGAPEAQRVETTLLAVSEDALSPRAEPICPVKPRTALLLTAWAGQDLVTGGRKVRSQCAAQTDGAFQTSHAAQSVAGSGPGDRGCHTE